jgi:hypothetical protein
VPAKAVLFEVVHYSTDEEIDRLPVALADL